MRAVPAGRLEEGSRYLYGRDVSDPGVCCPIWSLHSCITLFFFNELHSPSFAPIFLIPAIWSSIHALDHLRRPWPVGTSVAGLPGAMWSRTACERARNDWLN